jgi:hypothetical protein
MNWLLSLYARFCISNYLPGRLKDANRPDANLRTVACRMLAEWTPRSVVTYRVVAKYL